MAKRHTPEEIITKLRQVDVLVSYGLRDIDSSRVDSVGCEMGLALWLGLEAEPWRMSRTI